MSSIFDQRIEKLSILPDEWLLTDRTDNYDADDLRGAIIWEYARQSKKLRGLFEAISKSARKLIPNSSRIERADILYDLAGDCVASGFRNKSRGLQKMVIGLMIDVHALVPDFDWRLLLSPQFPDSPWALATGWDKADEHFWGWEGVAQKWKIRFNEYPPTIFEHLNYKAKALGPSEKTYFETERPVAAYLKQGLQFHLPLRAPIRVSIIFLRKGETDRATVCSVAQWLVEALEQQNSSPLRDDLAAAVARGNSRLDDPLIQLDAGAMEMVRCLHRQASISQEYELLFLPQLGPQRASSLALFTAIQTEFARRLAGQDGWDKSLSKKAECLRALKSLGAHRVKPHLTRRTLSDLWEIESEGLGSVRLKRAQREGMIAERKKTTNRPIFSKWDHLDSATNEAGATFTKLFPKLERSDFMD